MTDTKALRELNTDEIRVDLTRADAAGYDMSAAFVALDDLDRLRAALVASDAGMQTLREQHQRACDERDLWRAKHGAIREVFDGQRAVLDEVRERLARAYEFVADIDEWSIGAHEALELSNDSPEALELEIRRVERELGVCDSDARYGDGQDGDDT